MQPIPIFVITCDRVTVLARSIESYRTKLKTPITLVIHDNNSTYKPLHNYLKKLEREGVKVYRHEETISDADRLNTVAETISNWFAHNDAPYYIVTDPDIELIGDCDDMLDFYAHVLDTMQDVNVVAPMLRIDDIPPCYPLRERVRKRHTEQFWYKVPLKMDWQGRAIGYQFAPVDTTFGMYRKRYAFRRLSQGTRTYEPAP